MGYCLLDTPTQLWELTDDFHKKSHAANVYQIKFAANTHQNYVCIYIYITNMYLYTLTQTNIAPETMGLQYAFPFGKAS